MADFHLCSILGCGKPKAAGRKGYCLAHYKRERRHGDPTKGHASHGEPLAWLAAHRDHASDDCLFWPFATGSNGRGGVYHDGRVEKPACVMCEMAHGPRPSAEHHCAHRCGNGHLACCNQRHLRWATPSENEMDKIAHGTSNRGDRNGSAKLSPEQVLAIYQNRPATQASLAEQNGVGQQIISLIQQEKRWGWLTKQPTPQEP